MTRENLANRIPGLHGTLQNGDPQGCLIPRMEGGRASSMQIEGSYSTDVILFLTDQQHELPFVADFRLQIFVK